MKRTLGILLIAGLASAAAAQQYTVIDMGGFGGYATFGFGVNSSGHIVGATNPYANSNFHGLYFSGTAEDIVPLAGDTQCWAMAVNNSDTVAAMSFSFGALVPHGMIWQNGITTSLGDLAPRALNSLGTIVGYRSVSDTTYGQVDRPASWTAGIVTNLPTLGGSSGYAAGINDQGRIVGWASTTRDLQMRAVLWQGGTARDLGTLGGARSQAYAINSAGIVVGQGQMASGLMHAMKVTLDAAGNVITRTDLGTLGGTGTSIAYAINASSRVVGTSNSRAVVWAGTTPADLNTLIGPNVDWMLQRAWSISDAGQIVGSGLYGVVAAVERAVVFWKEEM